VKRPPPSSRERVLIWIDRVRVLGRLRRPERRILVAAWRELAWRIWEGT
jgi:hypothetical protein